MGEEEYYDFGYGHVTYMRPGVNLLVESEGESMTITHMDMTPVQAVHIIDVLVDKISRESGITYNEILEDMKEKESK